MSTQIAQEAKTACSRRKNSLGKLGRFNDTRHECASHSIFHQYAKKDGHRERILHLVDSPVDQYAHIVMSYTYIDSCMQGGFAYLKVGLPGRMRYIHHHIKSENEDPQCQNTWPVCGNFSTTMPAMNKLQMTYEYGPMKK